MEIRNFFSALRQRGLAPNVPGFVPLRAPGAALASRCLPELPATPEPRQGRAEPPRHPRPLNRREQAPLPGTPLPGTAARPSGRSPPHGRGQAAPARGPRAHPPVAPQRGRRSPPAAPAGTNSSGRKQEAPPARAAASAPPLPEVSGTAPPGVPCERRAPPAGGPRRCAGTGRGQGGVGAGLRMGGASEGRGFLRAGKQCPGVQPRGKAKKEKE